MAKNFVCNPEISLEKILSPFIFTVFISFESYDVL